VGDVLSFLRTRRRSGRIETGQVDRECSCEGARRERLRVNSAPKNSRITRLRLKGVRSDKERLLSREISEREGGGRIAS